jgi:hypothetical protein
MTRIGGSARRRWFRFWNEDGKRARANDCQYRKKKKCRFESRSLSTNSAKHWANDTADRNRGGKKAGESIKSAFSPSKVGSQADYHHSIDTGANAI